MRKDLENKLTMFEAVRQVLTESASRLSAVPALGASSTAFLDEVEKIKAKSGEVMKLSAGLAPAKWDAQDALLDTLVPVGSAIVAYASTVRDRTLREQSYLSDTSLKRLRDTELVTKAKLILDEARSRKTALSSYGVTDGVLSDLGQKIDTFSTSLAAKEGGSSTRMAAREEMLKGFDNADAILVDRIDRLMEMFRSSDPQMYNAYFGARVIKDIGIRHRDATEPVAPVTKP